MMNADGCSQDPNSAEANPSCAEQPNIRYPLTRAQVRGDCNWKTLGTSEDLICKVFQLE